LQITNYPFRKLPFSKLFQTYISDFEQLSDYFSTNPFDTQELRQKINGYEFPGDREQTVRILQQFNDRFDVDAAAQENIKRLKKSDALVIVTGQQLGVYGGPLYTVLKTISTIHLARKMERTFDRPVIPVFWLADEDHDYEEIRHVQLLDNDEDEVVEFSLPPKNDHLPTVAEMQIPDELSKVRDQIKEAIYDTDFSDDLWALLDRAFAPGKNFLQAFGTFISSLFSKHGLVLAGSNTRQVKTMTGDIFKQSITRAGEIRDCLEQQSRQVADNYHQQVTLYDSNLFYLDKESGRTKISRNGDGWKTEAGQEWSTDELVTSIEEEPLRFSPNVFLRPLVQDMLLPTLGYVAGPGETAYYAQMKTMYECFDLEMPVIFPRLSATMIEPAIDRIFNELPFEFYEYGNRIEDLESEFVDRTDQHDIEATFSDWKQKVQELADPKTEVISEIDPTLEGAAGKATAAYFGELDKLKGKVYRAVKQQEQTQLNRIRRIKANLFPGDGLQERVIAGIFFMNKYGVDLWDKVLKSLDEDENFDSHKLIYL